MPRYLHLLSFSLASAQVNLISSTLYSPAQPLPTAFYAPELADQIPLIDALLRRQASCAASYTSCTSNLCCQPDTRCTTDFAGNAACCPSGAVCTGTIGSATAYTSTTTDDGQTATNTAVAAGGAGTTVTVTAGYAAPSTVLGATTTIAVGSGATATITPLAGTTATGTVPNAPFAWAYIPHSFANAAQCSSYAASCSDTFSSCTSQLAASGNGVTVVGVGVTTANGAGLANVASAASVCSSLSTAACYGLQTTLCAQYGGSMNAAYGSHRGLGATGGLLAGILGAVFI